MAEAEKVQYPNNPIVAPAPAKVAPPAQEPQVPAAVQNEQRNVENAQPENYVEMQYMALHLFMNIKLNYVGDSNSTAWYINRSVNFLFPI